MSDFLQSRVLTFISLVQISLIGLFKAINMTYVNEIVETLVLVFGGIFSVGYMLLKFLNQWRENEKNKEE
tara:strand:+ start:497 stop:706 length:210 start_codon:yes stop_codon:yes gene_type:complete